jgi:isohexenylglutaconyl-CoA hydratase
MVTAPECETLLLENKGSVLHLTLNRAKARNAMSLKMVHELNAVCEWLETDSGVRAVVIRGAGGHFCAGGDIKDMAQARALAMSGEAGDQDPYFDLNRVFGQMIHRVERLPQVVLAVLEGAILGGGFGLASVCDIGIVHDEAKLGMPETTLGLIPAQIAHFVVRRIGLTQARRLALLGNKINGREAVDVGIAHYGFSSDQELAELLEKILGSINRCAPGANAKTKALMLDVDVRPLDEVLEEAAQLFSQAVQGSEGFEGTMAFIEKRSPKWAEEKGS